MDLPSPPLGQLSLAWVDVLLGVVPLGGDPSYGTSICPLPSCRWAVLASMYRRSSSRSADIGDSPKLVIIQ